MLVSRVVTLISRENMLRIFGFKTHKAKNDANFAHLEKNRPKSILLKWPFMSAFSRMHLGVPYFHVQTQMLLEMFCTFVLGLTFSLAFEMFFEDCCSGKPPPLQARTCQRRSRQSPGLRIDYRNEATIYTESRNIQLLFQFQCGLFWHYFGIILDIKK